MRLRKLQPHESSLLRELRLSALRNAPGSFRDTYADIAARPSSYWEELTLSVTQPGRNVLLLACEGDQAAGSAFGLVDQSQVRTGRVGGMWVDPAWRRQGVGQALLQGVIDWARERGFECLKLWCVADDLASGSLYRKAGFKETGSQQQLSEGSAIRVVEMELPLFVSE
ncbi:MAG: GNAT family N-acetyltransferase [Proteobacteria bacterium]|nr:GNAT family N-acetyltransferase [Pseudomonadota bacterium]